MRDTYKTNKRYLRIVPSDQTSKTCRNIHPAATVVAFLGSIVQDVNSMAFLPVFWKLFSWQLTLLCFYTVNLDVSVPVILENQIAKDCSVFSMSNRDNRCWGLTEFDKLVVQDYFPTKVIWQRSWSDWLFRKRRHFFWLAWLSQRDVDGKVLAMD